MAPACAMTSVRLVNGLDHPVFLTYAPGNPDQLFILEQHTGKIQILDRAAKTLQSTPFLTVSGVTTGNEQGLLGMAFHPDYQHNGFFYVNYTTTGGGPAGKTQIARFTVSSDPMVADPASKLVILEFDQPATNHNGGWIGFGPDGFLYIAAGDGGNGDDPFGTIGNGQNTNALPGKLLRIDVDHGSPYSIPDGNPFKGDTAKKQEIWAFGLRNPWRCSFDRSTGDLWIGDVGQNTREEIDFQAAGTGGQNYGWRVREGFIQNPNYPNETTVTPATDPVFDYDHTLGVAVIGGYRYRGRAIPALQGSYLFADNSSARIWTAGFNGTLLTSVTERQSELAPGGGQSINSIASFGEDIFGEIYICDLDGEIFKIVPTSATNSLPTAVISGAPLLSGAVNAALDFSASGSSDADGSVISYLWNFGDGSASVLTSTSTISHAYVAEGTFTVTLNVYDDRGDKSASATAQAAIGTSGGNGTPGDADGDGFSDELELALGTSASDATSTPFGGSPSGTTQALDISMLKIRLNFAKPIASSIQFAGTLPVLAGFDSLNQQVVVDVGGVVRTFVLNDKGKSPPGSDTFALRIKTKKGQVIEQSANFQAHFTQGTDFAAKLTDEGFTDRDAKKDPLNVPITLLFNRAQFQKSQPQIYTARSGKMGSTTIPK